MAACPCGPLWTRCAMSNSTSAQTLGITAAEPNPLTELASIFAVGLLRLQVRSVLPPADQPLNSPPDSGPPRLEVLPETVLSVSHGG